MKNIAVCIMAAWWFAACGNPVTSPERVDEWPDIYPCLLYTSPSKVRGDARK